MTQSPALHALVSRRSVLSSSILLTESFLRLGLVALVSFWIAHQLGPAQFGVLNYASALVMVWLSIATLGLDTPVVLRLSQNKVASEDAAVLGSALVLRLLAGGMCALAVCASAWFLRGGDGLTLTVAAIAALSVPLAAPAVLDCWFKAHNQALRPAAARLCATLLSCAVKVGCLVLGLGVVALAWTVTLEALLMAAALAWAYLHATRTNGAPALVAQWPLMRSLLKDSGPYVLSIAAIAAYMKVDIVLLGVLASDTEVGIYSLCQKLSEVLYILPVVVVDVLYPQLVRHQSGVTSSLSSLSPEGAGTTTQTFFDATLAVALLGTVLAIVLASWFVPLLFGEPYRRSAEIFQVHAWSCIGIASAHARYKWMAAAGLQRLAPAVTGIGLVLAVMLNLLLIPQWGGLGAAVATVTAYALSGHAASYMFPALRDVAAMQTRALWPWMRLAREFRRASQREQP